MHRERKYRVYDSQNEVMVYNIGIDPHGIAYAIPDDTTEDCTSFDYYPDDEPMEFTGIKDRNSTPIFEGDVVTGEVDMIGLPIKAKIVFEQGYFGILATISPETLPLYGIKNMKVIGNICENPELLDNPSLEA